MSRARPAPESGTGCPRSAAAPLIEPTEAAAAKIRELRAAQPAGVGVVRVTVRPEAPLEGKYELEFVAESARAADDEIHEARGVRFFVDAASAGRLRGTRMDYVEGMWEAGFRFHNPNRAGLMADPIAAHVQDVFERRLRPLVAQHGGAVTLIDVRDGLVHLELGGGCQGCGLAPVTLTQGIERILREEVPGFRGLVDTTDHAAGRDPYHR